MVILILWQKFSKMNIIYWIKWLETRCHCVICFASEFSLWWNEIRFFCYYSLFLFSSFHFNLYLVWFGFSWLLQKWCINGKWMGIHELNTHRSQLEYWKFLNCLSDWLLDTWNQFWFLALLYSPCNLNGMDYRSQNSTLIVCCIIFI